ncbi:hypothetical protein [Lentisphaera araneosa]|nr:hypothetical protein [Lentisphaera araneosa]
MNKWTRTDPAKAAKWLDDSNSRDNVKVVEHFLETAAWRDPALASKWVDRLPDRRDKRYHVKQIYQHWVSHDKQRADEFLSRHKGMDYLRKDLEKLKKPSF